MLSYKEFRERLITELKERLVEGYEIEELLIPKVNQELDAIMLKPTTEAPVKCGPVFYPEEIYVSFLKGRTMDDIVEDLIDVMNMPKPEMAESRAPLDFETCRCLIRPQLINAEKNRAFLEGVAHRPYLDLAIIYRVVHAEKGDTLSFVITNELLAAWNVSEQELNDIAMSNLNRNEQFKVRSLCQISDGLMDDDFPFYVLTNEEQIFGASALLSEKILSHASELFDGDYFILPSSMDEVILIPYDAQQALEMKKIVQSANRDVVAESDYLSDTVYYYNAARGEVQIAA